MPQGLQETPDWVPQIHQLSEDDPYEGGPPQYDAQGNPVTGWDNVQAHQLARRTAWLKAQVEDRATRDLTTALSGSVLRRHLSEEIIALIESAGLDFTKYRGVWDPATNTPAIPAAAAGNLGWWYVAFTAGTATGEAAGEYPKGSRIVSDGAAWLYLPPASAQGELPVFLPEAAYHGEEAKEILWAIVDADDLVVCAHYIDGTTFPAYLTAADLPPAAPSLPVFSPDQAFHNDKEILFAIVDVDDLVTFAQYADGTLYIAQAEDAGGGGGGGAIGGNDPRLVSDTVYAGGQEVVFGVETADGQNAFSVDALGGIKNPQIQYMGREIVRTQRQALLDHITSLMTDPSALIVLCMVGQSNARIGGESTDPNPLPTNGLVFSSPNNSNLGEWAIGCTAAAAGPASLICETGIDPSYTLVPWGAAHPLIGGGGGGLAGAYRKVCALHVESGAPVPKYFLTILAQSAQGIGSFSGVSGFYCNWVTILRWLRAKHPDRKIVVPFILVDHGEFHDWQGQADYDRQLEAVRQSWSDAAQQILGQRFPTTFVVSQVASHSFYGPRTPVAAQAQWRCERDNPYIRISCPQYQLGYTDGVHVDAIGHDIKGALHGKALWRIFKHGARSGCLRPDTITRSGNQITVTFLGRTGNLVASAISPTLGAIKPHWGFELLGTAAQITAIEFIDVKQPAEGVTTPAETSAIRVTTNQPATESTAQLAYAWTAANGNTGAGQAGAAHGNIRDSDPSTHAQNGQTYPLYNWLITFIENLN